jgi:hypothetical protein
MGTSTVGVPASDSNVAEGSDFPSCGELFEV